MQGGATYKKISSSLYGGKTFGPGRDGGREGSGGQLRRRRTWQGSGGSFLPVL